MPPRARSELAAIVLAVTALQTAIADAAFSKLVVFGDSLNDHGNMLQFTNGVFPAPPLYAPGRQSNGPVWVEYLASRLGLADKIVNYAVVGAMTKATPEIPTGNVWSNTFAGLEGTDVATQVLDYLADVNGTADPDALYILEGGSNDFPRLANPGDLVANLLESLVALEMGGARHIIVVNLPDLGKTPRVILGERLGELPPGTGQFVSAACAQLNQALVTALPIYTLSGVTITLGDAYAFISQAAANPAAFGFTNVQEPFLLFGNSADPAEWLFWDDLHPTTRGHELFAEQVTESLVRRYSPGKGRLGKGAINSLKGLVHAQAR